MAFRIIRQRKEARRLAKIEEIFHVSAETFVKNFHGFILRIKTNYRREES